MKNTSISRFLPDYIGLGVFWIVNIFFFINGTTRPQCCDSDWYQSEAKLIEKLGVIPNGDATWLSPEHNYFYSLMINILSNFGLIGRPAITGFQFVLIMLIATFIFLDTLDLHLLVSRRRTFQLILGALVFFLNINFTIYGITEGLAASLILLFFYSLARLTYLTNFSTWSYRVVVSISFLSAIIWMIRPSLTWIPLITLISIYIHCENFNTKLKLTSLYKVGMSLLIHFVVSLPQLLIPRSGSWMNNLFHLDTLGKFANFEANVLRYSTNLSGCGPIQLFYSPYSQDISDVYSNEYQQNSIIRFASFGARIVSGWDAFPSNFTYLSEYNQFLPLFLTSLAGLMFISPLFLAVLSVRSFDFVSKASSYRQLGSRLILPFSFIISQIAAGISHGEFRYNLIGWILGFICLSLLTRLNFSNANYFLIGALSFFVSISFLIIGQLTLLFSDAWLKCIS